MGTNTTPSVVETEGNAASEDDIKASKKFEALQMSATTVEGAMTDLSMPRSFLKAGQIKKYQMRSRKVHS